MQNADGIDINFELLPQDQKENLVIFMEGLSATLNMVIDNPILTMATPAIDWNDAWDYNQLASIVDGLFIMGYNYFYSGSTSAGPVSPLGGYLYDIDFTINDYLSKTNNLNEAAKNLYSILRKIKKDKYKSIAVEKIPNEGIGKTINDRLKRASNFK